MLIVWSVVWAIAGFLLTKHECRALGRNLGLPGLVAVPMLVAIGVGIVLLVTPPAVALVFAFLFIGLALSVWTDSRFKVVFVIPTILTDILVLVGSWRAGNLMDGLYGALLFAAFFGVFVLRSRGKEMGFGDVLLGFGVGAAFGLSGLMWVVLSFVVLLVLGRIYFAMRQYRGPFALGPYIAGGAACAFGFNVVVPLLMARSV